MVPAGGELAERIRPVQAALFGASGLLPAPGSLADADTRGYVEGLHALWEGMKRAFGGRVMDRTEWCFAGVRPVNYPTRRIAAAACLLGRHLHDGLFRAVVRCLEEAGSEGSREKVGSAALRGIQRLFEQEGRGYWATRSTFGGKRTSRAMRLVGRDRAAVMALDIVIPLLLCYARQNKNIDLERLVHAAYASIKRLVGNSVTRYMEGRVFPAKAAAREVVRTARRQQGLHQIYRDCCESRTTTCARCSFLAAIRSVA